MKIKLIIINSLICIFANTSVSLAESIPPNLISQLDRPFFFEDGDRLIQREVQNLQQQPNPVNLSVNQNSLQWQKFISRDGGFSVWIPGGLKSQETVSIDTTLGNIEFISIATDTDSSRFVAAYADKTNITSDNAQEILKAVRDGIVKKTDYKLISDKEVTIDNYPGKELVMQHGDETITIRIYVVENRLYGLAVRQPSGEDSAQVRENFFNTFSLLN